MTSTSRKHSRRIAAAAAGVEQAKQHLQEVVDAARAEGLTWQEVGDALGITRQSAHRRFDPRGVDE